MNENQLYEKLIKEKELAKKNRDMFESLFIKWHNEYIYLEDEIDELKRSITTRNEYFYLKDEVEDLE